jgi:tRNA(Ile)-lysidine synthase
MSKSVSIRVEQAAAEVMQSAGLFPQAGVIVTATSGGVDSVVLNQVLLNLGYAVHLAHVNYQKRGLASDQDELFVRTLAQTWDTEITVWQAKRGEAKPRNFQDWAREYRYERFQELADQRGAQAIALGHHADDRIETLLMRVMRGASPSHWDGLREWNPPLLRPLLGVSRKEILEYAIAHQLQWREDASNQDTHYARNLIRHELIPAIDHQLPGWKKNINRITNYGAMYTEAMDALLAPLVEGEGILVAGLKTHSSSLQQALLQRYLELNGFRVSVGTLGHLARLLRAQTGRWVTVEEETVLLRDRERLLLTTVAPTVADAVLVGIPPLNDPERDPSMQATWRVELPVASLSLVGPGYVPKTHEWVIPRVEGSLVARVWRAGDRIRKANGGTRKISDLINDWKIPAHLKRYVWVLTLNQNVMACIFGHPEYDPQGCVAPAWNQVNQNGQNGQNGILIRPKHTHSNGIIPP